MEFKEVHKGIDSLYLSFWGQLKDGLLEKLEQDKQRAQSDDIEDQAMAIRRIGDHYFEVRDKGQGNYSYVLVDNWFHIKVSASRKNLLPTIYVQISSELLNCSGVDYAIEQLRNVIKELLLVIENEKVSRVDVFVDFITDTDFEVISRKSWITRADQIHNYWTGNSFTGWTVGRGGGISARLYDKTIEIEISKKEFFKEIWKKSSWVEGQKVWRLEFQLKREFLTQLSVHSLADVVMGLNDIWKVCTCDWLRLAIENGNENRSRWDVAPIWINIQEIVFGNGLYSGLKREVSKSRVPSEEALFKNWLGYLMSYAVINDEDNLSAAAHSLLLQSVVYLDIDAINTKKEYRKFEDGWDYINKKMKLKKRKFNKPSDDIPF